MKPNPFHKYLTKEDHLQMQVVNYLRLQYPKVFWIHCPNEGKRTKFEQYKAKALGLTSGVPDLMIYRYKYKYESYSYGLAVELKVKPNRPTPNQIECMNKLGYCGWLCKVAYTFDEAKQIIDDYLK